MVVNNRTASGARYIARGSATREILRALKRKDIIGILMAQEVSLPILYHHKQYRK